MVQFQTIQTGSSERPTGVPTAAPHFGRRQAHAKGKDQFVSSRLSQQAPPSARFAGSVVKFGNDDEKPAETKPEVENAQSEPASPEAAASPAAASSSDQTTESKHATSAKTSESTETTGVDATESVASAPEVTGEDNATETKAEPAKEGINLPGPIKFVAGLVLSAASIGLLLASLGVFGGTGLGLLGSMMAATIGLEVVKFVSKKLGVDNIADAEQVKNVFVKPVENILHGIIDKVPFASDDNKAWMKEKAGNWVVNPLKGIIGGLFDTGVLDDDMKSVHEELKKADSFGAKVKIIGTVGVKKFVEWGLLVICNRFLKIRFIPQPIKQWFLNKVVTGAAAKFGVNNINIDDIKAEEGAGAKGDTASTKKKNGASNA